LRVERIRFLRSPVPQEENMNVLSPAVYPFIRELLAREEGQDLVEYALVCALISFGAITGMGFVATSVNEIFSGVATTFTDNV
jgi:Flp pilus assembly pilin Flp